MWRNHREFHMHKLFFPSLFQSFRLDVGRKRTRRRSGSPTPCLRRYEASGTCGTTRTWIDSEPRYAAVNDSANGMRSEILHRLRASIRADKGSRQREHGDALHAEKRLIPPALDGLANQVAATKATDPGK